MTVREYINTFEDAGLILAYIECVKDGKVGGVMHKKTVYADIDNDEYEDVKYEVDELIKEAQDTCMFPDPVRTEEDIYEYLKTCVGDGSGNDPEYLKYKKIWEKDPWTKFFQSIDEICPWFEHDGYYFMDTYNM